MTRFFYVDAAKVKDKESYWKCSVVENQKNIINFYNGKAKCSTEAEAFAILKTVFWLVEQKQQGEVIIYSDCSSLTGYQKMKKIATRIKNKEKEPKKYTRKRKIKNRTSEFLLLTKAIAWRNNLNLKIRWVKGKENPADYYSRLNGRKPNKPTRPEKAKPWTGPNLEGQKDVVRIPDSHKRSR